MVYAGFVLSEFFAGVRRNVAMTLSVILVTFVSLTFVGAGMLVQSQINLMKGYWYDKVQVSIFLCTKDSAAPTCAAGEVTPSQRAAIEQDLKSATLAPYIEQVTFESKQEAYQHFREQFADSPTVLQNVTAEQMPESFRVKLKDAQQYKVVQEFFAGKDGVESVADQRKVLEPLFSVLRKLTLLAAGVAGVMVVAAILLITTTIRLSAFNRRREVGIMRLVGASSTVIQLPFLLEGVFAACVGAGLASAGLYTFLATRGTTWLTGNLGTRMVNERELLTISPVLFGIAIALSAVSSAVALNRYLKV